MAYQDQFYTVGTVTVTGGSTAVTGASTGWETALIVGGVFYAGGGAYPIQSVSSETELTLAIPYVGDDAAGLDYAIDRQRAAAISNIAMNDRLAQIIREISIGNIEDLNALDLIANQVLGTDVAGHITQVPLTALGRAFLALTGANGQFPAITGAGTVVARPIVGVVSQSGGVPSGAIIEYGGTAVSGYMRLAGGLQVCWADTQNLPADNTAAGAIFRSGSITMGAYPAAFVAIPMVLVGGTGGAGGGWTAQDIYQTTTLWGSFSIRSATNIGTNARFFLLAVGRWY